MTDENKKKGTELSSLGIHLDDNGKVIDDYSNSLSGLDGIMGKMRAGFEGIAALKAPFVNPVNISGLNPSGPSRVSKGALLPDKRTRAEVREDFDLILSKIDKQSLVDLKQDILDYDVYDDGAAKLWGRKDEIENAIIKFIRTIDTFENLNSDAARRIEIKEKELKLEARSDWGSKFRLFLFRVLASALFVFTLFLIGYLEKNYDWAVLPMSAYINTDIPAASK